MIQIESYMGGWVVTSNETGVRAVGFGERVFFDDQSGVEWTDECAVLEQRIADGLRVVCSDFAISYPGAIYMGLAGPKFAWEHQPFEVTTDVGQLATAARAALLKCVTSKSEPEPVEEKLRQARARRELHQLREARLVVEASEQGLSQRSIGDLLGRSQTDVFRMLKSARARADVQHESVREIVLRFAAGEVSRGAVVGRLTGLTRGHAAGPELVDGYVHGELDDVKVAWLDGLIDDDLYEEIELANRPRHMQRGASHE